MTSGDESEDIIKKLKIDLSPVPKKTGTPSPTPDAENKPSISPTETKPEDGLTFDEFSEKEEAETDLNIPDEIEIPGLSVVSTKDLGVVGLVRDGDRTTLLIMASSPENLKSFVEELTINGLSGCLIKDNLAACKVTGTDPGTQRLISLLIKNVSSRARAISPGSSIGIICEAVGLE